MKFNFKKIVSLFLIVTMFTTMLPASFVYAEDFVNLASGAAIVSGVTEKADSTVTWKEADIKKMFDDDNTTFLKAGSQNISGTFILDYGENQIKEFNRVSIYKPNDTPREFKLTVQVSDDSVVWSDALNGAVVPNEKETELIYDFPKISGRYVRFHIYDIIKAGSSYGFAISELKLFMIPDTTTPVITLNGDETIELDIGDEYVEPGYTASDNIDGDLTQSVVVSGDTVNTQIRGTYTIRYNVSDAAGNAATEKTRTVNVGVDKIPPVITLTGDAEIDIPIGESFEEPGYTATDNIDGDLTQSVIVSGDIVNTEVKGTYIIRYNVSDASGNAAEEKIRTIYVGFDRIPPVLTLKGSDVLDIGLGGIFIEPGYTAYDNVDGDISESVIISGDTVDVNSSGTYEVQYNVADKAGNTSSATRVVRIVENLYGSNLCTFAALLNGGSGADSTSKANLFDGDSATKYKCWSSSNGKGEFILDLGSQKSFNQFVAVQADTSSVPFKVSVYKGESESGPWSEKITSIDVPAKSGETVINGFDTVNARYVRFYIEQPEEKVYSAAELQLYMDEDLYVTEGDINALYIPQKTGTDILLPSSGIYGSDIEWKSSDTNTISNEGKLISRPSAAEGQKIVTLTAQLSCGDSTVKKEIQIMVTPKNPAENAIFTGGDGVSVLGDGNYNTSFDITNGSTIEIALNNVHHLGVAVLEMQSNNKLIKATIYAHTSNGYVKLGEYSQASRNIGAVQIKFDRGTYQKLKLSFETSGNITVSELILGMTDRDAVDYMAENLTVSDEDLSSITKDLILRKNGDYGQKIEWKSSNTSVVLDNGTVIRQSVNQNVKITATVTKGTEKASRDFNITVLKKPSQGNTGGNAGGTISGGGTKIPFTQIQPSVQNTTMLGMTSSHWAFSYVEKLSKLGIVSGNENGDFEPDKEITRAEYIKILVNAFGIKEQGEAPKFSDVSNNDWYAQYIRVARSVGIVAGDENNRALPLQKISRQDMAVMLGRTIGILSKELSIHREYNEFSDNEKISPYARDYVEALYCAKILDGMDNGEFSPEKSATKAQAAKIIASML